MAVRAGVAAVAMVLLLAGCSTQDAGEAVLPAEATATVTVTATATATTTVTAEGETTPPSAEPTTPLAAPETVAHASLRGTLQLFVNRNPNYLDNCAGFQEEGYGDIHVGQQVVVSGQAGQVLAIGQLTGCKFSPIDGPDQARGILFDFVVKEVPEAPFVKVVVGTGQRGGPTYSWSQLEQAGWNVALTL